MALRQTQELAETLNTHTGDAAFGRRCVSSHVCCNCMVGRVLVKPEHSQASIQGGQRRLQGSIAPRIPVLIASHCSSASRMVKETARSWLRGFLSMATPPSLSRWLSPRMSLFPRVSVSHRVSVSGGGGAAGRGRHCWGAILALLRGPEAWALRFFFSRLF